MALTTTSQATSTLVATHRPTAELVARSHRPEGPRSLLEEWARLKARQTLIERPAVRRPMVVMLPPELLN
jgi:hypothetical protein